MLSEFHYLQILQTILKIVDTICTKIECKTEQCTENGLNMYPATRFIQIRMKSNSRKSS